MTGMREAKTPFLASLLARTGILTWSPADKCLFGALVVLPFAVSYAGVGYYVIRHPEAAPFVDRGFLRVAYDAQLGWIVGWLVIAAAALWLRWTDPTNRPIMHATAQLYTVMMAAGSYFTGHYTSLFLGIVGPAGVTIGLILFDRRVVLWSLGSLVLIVLSTTAAEQLGLIPYAPLLADAPFAHGRLSGWWLAGLGVGLSLSLVAVVALIFFIIESWRDREVRLAETSDQLARANDLISRYVAAQVAEQILAGKHSDLARHARRRLTLFFSDIKGFSEVADEVEPEDLSRILNEYLAEMTTIAERHGGTVDKFMGDAIMILFGAPVSTDDRDQALRAVRMALEMQERMGQLHDKWLAEGMDRPFRIRIGINTGAASVGSFGAKGRMDYTAIGRQVNLAARLQVSCPPGSVLMSHATWVLVQGEIPCIARGEIALKGFRHPVRVYEVAAVTARA